MTPTGSEIVYSFGLENTGLPYTPKQKTPPIFLIPSPNWLKNPKALSQTLVLLPERITLQQNKTLHRPLVGSLSVLCFSQDLLIWAGP